MSKNEDDYMEMEGTVESICRDKFNVLIDDIPDMKIVATVSGRIRISGIKVLAGDRVKCLVSSHDPTKGRIIYRMKE